MRNDLFLNSHPVFVFRFVNSGLLLLICVFLEACGQSGTSSVNVGSKSMANVSWSGTVSVAGQPLSGAEILIYSAGTGRNVSPVLLARAMTDRNGTYAVTSVASPPSQGQLIYAIANGPNSASRLMTVMGAYCDAATNCNFQPAVTINELSTVSAAYGFAAYTTSTKNVSVAGGEVALQIAASTFNSLVNPVTGTLSASLASMGCANGIQVNAPNCTAVQKLNTLANLLTSCTSALSPSSISCVNWLHLSADATDALGVLLQIITQPSLRNNGGGVFAVTSPKPIFSPVLTSAPTDWSLALNVTGGGLNGPVAIAIDATGQVWISDSLGAGALSVFGPDGRAISSSQGLTGNGISGPQGIAVDASGQVWVANWAQGSGRTISVFNPDGSVAPGSPIRSTDVAGVASVSGPMGLGLTASGNMWVANYGNSTLSLYSQTQKLLMGPVSGAGLSFPVNVSVDHSGLVWSVNSSNASVSEFSSMGMPMKSNAYQNIGLSAPDGLAVTSSGNVWIASPYNNTLIQLMGGSTPPSSCLSPIGFSDTGCVSSVVKGNDTGLDQPVDMAIDGSGNLWVVNMHGASLEQFSSDGQLLSPPSGYQALGMVEPKAVAVDAAGNIWVVNYASHSLTKFIGMASPVATPKQGPPKAL